LSSLTSTIKCAIAITKSAVISILRSSFIGFNFTDFQICKKKSIYQEFPFVSFRM
jgi:hypothetical protein